jgi:hypothetical protein
VLEPQLARHHALEHAVGRLEARERAPALAGRAQHGHEHARMTQI